MGTSTNAVLAYGYDLGGDEEGWKIQEADEYGELPEGLAWYDPDGDDDLADQAHEWLLAKLAGFPGKRHPGEHENDFFDREKVAKELVGVEFESYCSSDYPMYVLAAHAITVYRGHSEVLDLGSLATDPAVNGWDDKLAAALAALGITPKQEKPGWVLVSYSGG